MERKIYLLLVLIGLLVSSAIAQKRPLDLSPEKKLSMMDSIAKEEGVQFEPLPQVGYDHLSGLSYGLIGSLFNNGNAKDPFYQYQNYKFRLDFAAGGSYKSGQESIWDGDNQFYLKFDAPYVGGSRVRLSGSLNIEHNPYNLYYGITAASLRPLDQLTQTDNELYNYFDQKEKLANFQAAYMLCHGFLWPFVGVQFMDEEMTSNSNTLLAHDIASGQIHGYGHSQIAYLRAGIKYDTRNNSDNPTKGMVLEMTDQYAPKIGNLKSSFNKVFVHANFYTIVSERSPRPFFHWNTPRVFGPRDSVHRKINDLHWDWFSQNILAVRYALGNVSGTAPFYAYQDVWSSEDNITVLGGDYNLRGYDETRFAGNVVNFIDVEWRANVFKVKDYTVEKMDKNKHKIRKTTDYYDVAVVPFFDVGGVWDRFGDYFQQFNHYRCSYGMGARAVLNGDFVVRLDWGFSSEGSRPILAMSHTF